MILSIFLFFLFTSIGLAIAGFMYKGELKYGAQLFHIASSFLLLMCGLIILTQGVEFKTGSIVNTINATTTNITYTYDSIRGGLQGSYGLSYLLILLSFAFFLYTFFEIKYSKKNELNNKDYGEEE
jgi:uncharacterized membrane protein